MKRNIQSAILLSVILPVLLLAPFHRHHQATTSADCQECVAHQHHSGHIAVDGSLQDCLVCQLLGEAFLPSAGLTANPASLLIQDSGEKDFAQGSSAPILQHAPRAPPVFSFSPA